MEINLCYFSGDGKTSGSAEEHNVLKPDVRLS
jgi:hypothetical protein